MPNHKHPGALERFAMLIKRVHDFANHPACHVPVDLASELDEACIQIVFTRFPSKIEGIGWITELTQAWPRLVQRKTE